MEEDKLISNLRNSHRILFWTALLGCLGIWLYDFGFHTGYFEWGFKDTILTVLLFPVLTGLALRAFKDKRVNTHSARKYYWVLIVWGTFIFISRLLSIHSGKDFGAYWEMISFEGIFQVFILAVFVLEISKASVELMHRNLGPAKILAFSFLLFITMGTLLLLVPNASVIELNFVDALFMATSAVCITGLSVIDVSTDLTTLGHTILMFLFQLGGIGIMTFTSFFAFFFQGGASYTNQVHVRDFINSKQLNDLFTIILRILVITFFLEALGAIAIYFFTDSSMFNSTAEHWYFALFHSISGFCSAGFTLMSGSMHDEIVRFNYPLQSTIMILFILGGLGFGVLHNYSVFSKEYIRRKFRSIFLKERFQRTSLLLNINTKIVVRVSILLFIAGSLLYYFLEFNNSLSDHKGFGKFIAAMFAGATPRSAGFNNVDMDTVTFPAIMILLLYMWIGTGPASTGGGIKVTTFTVATLNVLSLVRGKDRVEVMNREISSDSIKRAFAVISLSLIFIGMAVFLLSISDGEKGLLPIAFECFSAYCTVGLSLGITPDLSNMGKLVISASMFIGRLSAITILSAMLTQVSVRNYNYPKEDIYMT